MAYAEDVLNQLQWYEVSSHSAIFTHLLLEFTPRNVCYTHGRYALILIAQRADHGFQGMWPHHALGKDNYETL